MTVLETCGKTFLFVFIWLERIFFQNRVCLMSILTHRDYRWRKIMEI